MIQAREADRYPEKNGWLVGWFVGWLVKVYWCFQHNLGCIMPLELHFIIEIHFF